MALDPVIMQGMDAFQPQQFLPEIRVQCRFLIAFHPAPRFPALGPPLGESVDHIFGIAPQLHNARLFQQGQRPDHCRQLHAVIGGSSFPAGKFPPVGAVHQDRSPAAGARIAGAGAIRVDRHLFHRYILSVFVLKDCLMISYFFHSRKKPSKKYTPFRPQA